MYIGSYTSFETDRSNRFRRCFFIPACCMRCVQLCKPFIALDGAHLKGPYKDSAVVLAASMKDGDNHPIIVAIALVPSECYEHWKWFLEELKASNFNVPEKHLFISDRQKGNKTHNRLP